MNFALPDGPSDVYVEEWRTARKHHRCCCCGHVVVPGSQYRCDRIVDDGRAWTEKCCFACAAALTRYRELHGQCPSPSWFADVLREDAADSRRWGSTLARRLAGKREYRESRDMFAGVLRRWRQAPARQILAGAAHGVSP
jgi:hypothetical protein